MLSIPHLILSLLYACEETKLKLTPFHMVMEWERENETQWCAQDDMLNLGENSGFKARYAVSSQFS